MLITLTVLFGSLPLSFEIIYLISKLYQFDTCTFMYRKPLNECITNVLLIPLLDSFI